jgi:hypothetical protein
MRAPLSFDEAHQPPDETHPLFRWFAGVAEQKTPAFEPRFVLPDPLTFC